MRWWRRTVARRDRGTRHSRTRTRPAAAALAATIVARASVFLRNPRLCREPDSTYLPRSGYTPKPRVAQRTLGSEFTDQSTLKALHKDAALVQPFQGRAC